MLTFAVILLAAATARVVFVLVSPIRVCSWCKGTRRAKRHRYWGRVGKCRKCKGRGKHSRLGAKTVHKARQLIRDDLRERRNSR